MSNLSSIMVTEYSLLSVLYFNTMNQILLSNVAQNLPPPLSCLSGFSCRRITLEGVIGIETGVNGATKEIFVGLVIAGVSLGGIVLSLSNPRAILGGEIYIAKAELVLEFAIENNLPVLYLSGEKHVLDQISLTYVHAQDYLAQELAFN